MRHAVFIGCLLASACIDIDDDEHAERADRADNDVGGLDGSGGSSADAAGADAGGGLALCSFEGGRFRSLWLETYEWGEFEGSATVVSVRFERVELGIDWEGFEADSLVVQGPFDELDLNVGDVVDARVRIDNYGPSTEIGIELGDANGLILAGALGRRGTMSFRQVSHEDGPPSCAYHEGGEDCVTTRFDFDVTVAGQTLRLGTGETREISSMGHRFRIRLGANSTTELDRQCPSDTPDSHLDFVITQIKAFDGPPPVCPAASSGNDGQSTGVEISVTGDSGPQFALGSNATIHTVPIPGDPRLRFEFTGEPGTAPTVVEITGPIGELDDIEGETGPTTIYQDHLGQTAVGLFDDNGLVIGYVDLTIATFEALILDRRREPFGSIMVRRGGSCAPNADTCRADFRVLLADAEGGIDLMAGEPSAAEWGGRTYDIRVGHASSVTTHQGVSRPRGREYDPKSRASLRRTFGFPAASLIDLRGSTLTMRGGWCYLVRRPLVRRPLVRRPLVRRPLVHRPVV